MRLLLIEDDAVLRLGLKRQLEAEGYRVDMAADGEDGLFQAREYPLDLAIVDLGLPKLNGLTVVQTLRAEGRTLPILILTARGSWQDKVLGLEAGADDYLVKPFEYPELAARVKALLRRAHQGDLGSAHAGAAEHRLFCPERPARTGAALDLTTFEYRVLEYLVRERARVVSKQELSDYLYPHDEDRDSNVLEVLIGRLRRKLDPGRRAGAHRNPARSRLPLRAAVRPPLSIRARLIWALLLVCWSFWPAPAGRCSRLMWTACAPRVLPACKPPFTC